MADELMEKSTGTGLEIAVIGMTGRFPGAKNIDEFWANLRDGVESISFFSKEELEKSGVDPALINNPAYVNAKGILEDVDYFDAACFDYTAAEAKLMDPQLRIFHECTWEALENAGYEPGSYNGKIGIYAGASPNFFWQASSLLSSASNILDPFSIGQLIFRDFLTTRISFKFNLRGPSFLVQTACSTSLVAIHLACQALLSGECSMALAGGVSITIPQESGYLYQEGMVRSPDGHCRTFDADAKGFCGGNGAGVVVLKLLEDAIAHGDYIHAVIKSSSINNDGNQKAGFTAPSIKAQSGLIKAALSMAELEPESIGYIEAHGTGTPLGDPIEIEALKRAFNTKKGGFCKIGSVKTNIGHLDAASGVAGFIKTVLVLKHRQIPPSLFFKAPNPKIDFENSPFIVNTQLTEWKNDKYPLRAGVSSFGIGGTNAHVILEEWPGVQGAGRMAQSSERMVKGPLSQGRGGVSPPDQSRQYQLILLSAKTQTVLDRMTENLTTYFKKNPGINLADAAYTLQQGRRSFNHRKMLVCHDVNEAIDILSSPDSGKLHSSFVEEENKPVVFMFSGQGSQYVNMGLELYQTEPVFRQEMDRCFEILTPLMGHDIKEILYPHSDCRGGYAYPPNPVNSPLERSAPKGRGVSDINQTEIAQPLLFAFEYALAKLLMKWGITPHAMIGHSIGEYVAAHLSGVFSLENALKMMALRGKLMQEIPTGTMLSIELAEDKLKPLMDEKISLAAVNSSSHCVVSGSHEAIDKFAKELEEIGYNSRKLHTSHAFHSMMMDPILKEFEKQMSQIKLNKPGLPFISNVTGDWITVVDAIDPRYWAKHLRMTVRFGDGMKELLKKESAIFIELGPGKTLSTFVRQHENKKTSQFTINLVRHPKEKISDVYYLLSKLGQLWLYDIKINWSEFYSKEKRHRIPLPTYPFNGQRFQFERDILKKVPELLFKKSIYYKNPDISEWFYIPVWEQSILTVHDHGEKNRSCNWLLFIDDLGLGTRLVKRLQKDGQHVVVVKAGNHYAKLDDLQLVINPGNSDDYGILFDKLQELNMIPNRIIHLWSISENNSIDSGFDEMAMSLYSGLYSLLYTVQAMGRHRINNDIQILVVTNNMQDVTGEEELSPLKAAVLGPIKIIPLEYPNISCRSVDIVVPGPGSPNENKLLEYLLGEFESDFSEILVAYRGNHRWVQKMKPHRLEKSKESIKPLKEKGCYLITGGFGGMGFAIAGDLAKRLKARLVLVGRSAFPPRKEWKKYLTAQDNDDNVSFKIRKILEFEDMGAEIMVASADVSDEERMREVISRAEKRFGKINGIIHTAGLADYEGVIQRRTRQMIEKVMAPKVKGTIVLNRIFKDKKLDFFALFSSLGNLFYKGKFGQVGYNAANEFLDAFAHYKSKKDGIFTVAINWSDWQEVGMTVEAMRRRSAKEGESIYYRSNLEGALSPSEGIEVFNRILENRLTHIAVLPQDLMQVLEQMNNADEKEIVLEAVKKAQSSTLLERPYLSTKYVAPRNETEQELANIWEKFFGLQQVGIHDDFFELGGDSLKAVTVKYYIGEMGFNISLNDILAYPTISGLASIIGEKNISKKSGQDTYEERLLSKLECVEKLNKGKNENNIFIIHPLHGMVNQYKELAELLENNYNVYGIQARGLVSGTQMAVTPGEMINDYLNQILVLQKGGPYIIAGYCVGNTIAYEIVRRLEKMNYPVEKLIMFDLPELSESFIKRIQMLEYLPEFVKKMIISFNEKRVKKIRKKEKSNKTAAMSDNTGLIDEAALRKDKVKDNIELLTNHILPLEIVKAPILVPKAKENPHPLAAVENFSKITKGKATVIETPGDHDSILEKPYVENLAEILKNM